MLFHVNSSAQRFVSLHLQRTAQYQTQRSADIARENQRRVAYTIPHGCTEGLGLG